MRGSLVAILTCLALSQAQAQSPPQTYPCNNDHYVNSVGHTVHSPSCGWEPGTKTAVCGDGSISHSEHHSGTCSHHGGVARWE